MNNLHEISSESIVCRYRNGVKLLHPRQAHLIKNHSTSYKSTGHTVSSIHQLPLCIYMMNTEHQTLKLNEATAEATGFLSVADGIGRTVLETFQKESARQTHRHDNQVMNNNQITLLEQEKHRKDGEKIHTLAIKSPWYNDEDKIIGIFGCTIVFGMQSLSQSLTEIAKLGLLDLRNNVSEKVLFSGKEIDGVYLSNRESECLRHYAQGKTAREIAQLIYLSKRTVENYIYNIKIKLGVSTKSELIYKTLDYFNHST